MTLEKAERFPIETRKLFGKYKGTVVGNVDSTFRGRLLVQVPSISGLQASLLPTGPWAHGPVRCPPRSPTRRRVRAQQARQRQRYSVPAQSPPRCSGLTLSIQPRCPQAGNQGRAVALRAATWRVVCNPARPSALLDAE